MKKATWGKITNTHPDTNALPIKQVTALGNINNAIIVQPYGLHTNPPAETLVYVLCPEKNIVMPVSAIGRIPVELSEVSLQHADSKTIIRLEENGNAVIENENGLSITLSATGISMVGNVTIDGTLTVTDDTTLESNLDVDGATALGVGGPAIARVGDSVFAGPTFVGAITSGSATNTAN